jgi:hypothetical protein
MAHADIKAGICGFHTIVEALPTDDPRRVTLAIQSECKAIQRLAADLTEVDPFGEISFRRGSPVTLEKAAEYCSHAACPVPTGIIKAIEVAAGLALPGDVTITLSKNGSE